MAKDKKPIATTVTLTLNSPLDNEKVYNSILNNTYYIEIFKHIELNKFDEVTSAFKITHRIEKNHMHFDIETTKDTEEGEYFVQFSAQDTIENLCLNTQESFTVKKAPPPAPGEPFDKESSTLKVMPKRFNSVLDQTTIFIKPGLKGKVVKIDRSKLAFIFLKEDGTPASADSFKYTYQVDNNGELSYMLQPGSLYLAPGDYSVYVKYEGKEYKWFSAAFKVLGD